MDKTAIRNFAIEARKILMKSAITEAGFYGITKDGCKDPVQKGNDFEVYETVAGTENRIFGDDIKRRANLVQAIKTLGFEQVIEETAYTWFNRIIAIRFMEVNNYLPTRVRVLSSETGSGTPDIITQADTVELNLTSDELEKIQTAKRENRYDDAFRMLFIKQCNELNAILPGLFEKTDDYMELLLKITYTGDGVIRMLVDSIPEDNFNVETEGQVEIIGWMYQYYNTELKDDTFARLKKNIKVSKDRLPAATQLFTPDWIVRYMVDNSLGRIWIEHLRAVNPSVDEKAKAEEFGWKYYLPEAEQEDDVQTQLVEIRKSYRDLTPQDITCIDPCMGSGHILVYMFDVLMDIYRSEGFSEREAVFDILEKNIHGLDIDRRAYQLSYFALMMKARGYNRIFFRGHEDMDGNRVQVVPRVYFIEESNSIDRNYLNYFGAGLDELNKNNAINQLNRLLDALHDAKEYGSILNIEKFDWKLLRDFLGSINDEGQASLFGFMAYNAKDILMKLIDIAETLADSYSVVVTNPPYLGGRKLNDKMLEFLNKYYEEGKADLFSAFLIKCAAFCKTNGFRAMITQQAWMFITSYEKLRGQEKNYDIINMAQLGARAFDEIGGEVVQTTAFVKRNSSNKGYKGAYLDLTDYDGEEEKRKHFLSRDNLYYTSMTQFDKIVGSPISYWASDRVYDLFETQKLLKDFVETKQGLKSSDDNRFFRLWTEVEYPKIELNAKNAIEAKSSTKKWFLLNKGGRFKWYGDYWHLINWENDGEEIKGFAKEKYKSVTRTITSIDYYFREAISWPKITSSPVFREIPEGYIFSDAGSAMFYDPSIKLYLLGFLNTCIVTPLTRILNPTINLGVGDMLNIPFIYDSSQKEAIESLVSENIEIAKCDWDSFEISRDYKRNPLIGKSAKVQEAFKIWAKECEERFNKTKANEQKLNEIFLEIYGLVGEYNPEVMDENITIRLADEERDIKALISYAVGCIMGRYSLDEEGVVYAGGTWNADAYARFKADEDGIIPITDEKYFGDDIVARFEEWLDVAFGAEHHDENIKYISEHIGGKGGKPEEVIRNYFLNDFYKDHCNLYSTVNSGKRPIYWMFDAGKQNSFKCLTYLHRYTLDTVGRIRSDYLSKSQTVIENALKNVEYMINSTTSAVDKAQATKKRDKYIKQLAEIKAYYPALSHIALQRVDLDLDDGVKANYEKFQNIEVSVEGEKKQKVNLLAKI